MNSIKSVGAPSANPFGDPELPGKGTSGIRSTAPTRAAGKDDLKAQNEQAATQLEAYFLRTVMQETRANVDDNSPDGGFAGSTFRDMLDGALTDKMASGQGMGLKKVIIESLERSQKAGATGDRQPHDAAEIGRITKQTNVDAIAAHRALQEK
jgi:Rod binding domain-containing protein